MKSEKNRDGYFTNNDIDEQAHAAIDILTEFYPKFNHVFIYNNTSSHLKQPDASISARRMPKFTPKPGINWGVEVSKCDDTGNLVYNLDGSVTKKKVYMADSILLDGTV
jgi:hypothetical protein